QHSSRLDRNINHGTYPKMTSSVKLKLTIILKYKYK
ncbi:MAG: hypothetical protein ACI8XG_001302, partial [Congregibacter sp.]